MPKIQTIVIGAIVAAVVAIAGLLSTQTWNPSWNPFQPTSQDKTVENAFANLATLKSLKYEAQVSADEASSTSDGTNNLAITLAGQLDMADTANAKSQVLIDFLLNNQGSNVQAGLEIRGINETLYIKINSLPSILAAFLSPELLDLQGKWLKINKTALEQLSGQAQATNTDKAVLEEQSKQLLQQIKEMVLGKELFNIEETLQAQEIKGVMADHYLVSINKEGLKELIPEYFALLKNNELTKAYASQLSDEEITKAMKDLPAAIDNAWQKLGGIEFEIWVTQADGRLTKIKFEREFTGQELNQTDATGKVKINIGATLYDFDEPVAIEEPAEAQNIEDILAPLLNSASALMPTAE